MKPYLKYSSFKKCCYNIKPQQKVCKQTVILAKKGSERKGQSILKKNKKERKEKKKENSSWSHYLQFCFNLWMPVAGVGVGLIAISLGPANFVAVTDKDKSEQKLPANWRLGRLSPEYMNLGKASLSLQLNIQQKLFTAGVLQILPFLSVNHYSCNFIFTFKCHIVLEAKTSTLKRDTFVNSILAAEVRSIWRSVFAKAHL